MSCKGEQKVANTDSEIDTDSNSDESGEESGDTLISKEHSDSESTDSDNDINVKNDIYQSKC